MMGAADGSVWTKQGAGTFCRGRRGGGAEGLPSVQGYALGMDGQEDISTEDRASGEQWFEIRQKDLAQAMGRLSL